MSNPVPIDIINLCLVSCKQHISLLFSFLERRPYYSHPQNRTPYSASELSSYLSSCSNILKKYVIEWLTTHFSHLIVSREASIYCFKSSGLYQLCLLNVLIHDGRCMLRFQYRSPKLLFLNHLTARLPPIEHGSSSRSLSSFSGVP